MTICHYTNTVSAHQLPLDRELVKLVGAENFRYVYDNSCIQGGAQEVSASDPWVMKQVKGQAEGEERKNSTVHLHLQPSPSSSPSPLSSIDDWLENCDLLIVGGIRPIDLMERRLAAGKAVFYMAERWFKPFLIYVPIPFFDFDFELRLPGWLRLLHPCYFKMARRFVRLFDSPVYRFLPIGPHSARDMRCLQRIMGKVNHSTLGLGLQTSANYIPWGDFVEKGKKGASESSAEGGEKSKFGVEVEERSSSALGFGLKASTKTLRILWVGRMLKLKHVETIIRAVACANKSKFGVEVAERNPFSLTMVGDGPEKPYLQRLASKLEKNHVRHSSLITPCSSFEFRPPVSLAEVREVMRQHDVYVFASNGYDGWGAVVPEAMTEGMPVLGTYEAGASAALLPKENLFHCGDWRTLAKMLGDHSYRPTPLPYDYTPEGAAKRLVAEFDIMRGML